MTFRRRADRSRREGVKAKLRRARLERHIGRTRRGIRWFRPAGTQDCQSKYADGDKNMWAFQQEKIHSMALGSAKCPGGDSAGEAIGQSIAEFRVVRRRQLQG